MFKGLKQESPSNSAGELLGSLVNGTYQRKVSAADPSFVGQHQVFDTVVMPGAGYVSNILLAAHLKMPKAIIQLTKVKIGSALPLKPHSSITLETSVGPEGEALVKSELGEHLTGQVTYTQSHIDPHPLSKRALKSDAHDIDHNTIYNKTTKIMSLSYGPMFRGLKSGRVEMEKDANGSWINGDVAQGVLAIHPDLNLQGHAFHPALLDAGFHILLSMVRTQVPHVPTVIGSLSFDPTQVPTSHQDTIDVKAEITRRRPGQLIRYNMILTKTGSNHPFLQIENGMMMVPPKEIFLKAITG